VSAGGFCERCRAIVDEPASHALSHELRDAPWGYLRGLQWERPTPGGVILSMPDCFRVQAEAVIP
jgi:hypothetical protein